MVQRKYLLAQISVAIVTFIAFYPSLSNGWTTWDDNGYVTDNPVIREITAENLKQVTTSVYVGSYLPLTMVSYMLDYSVNGYDAYVFHRSNLALHIVNTVLVFWFILLLSDNFIAALVVSLLFGIHPMRVESVAWISGRKDLLSMFFFLLASIAYLFHRKNENSYWLTVSFLLFVCAILSKIIVLTFPVLLLLYDWYSKREASPRVMIEKIPFFIVSAALSVIGFIGQDSVNAVRSTVNIAENTVVSLHGVVFYLEKFFVPVNLSNLYPYPSEIPLVFYIYAVISVALSGVIWKFKKNQVILFGSLFYVISLLPVLQFVRFSKIFAADRFTYFAYIGLFFIAGVAASHAWEKYNKKLLLTLLSVVVLSMSYGTWERSEIWKDSGTLWQDMLSKYPDWMKHP